MCPLRPRVARLPPPEAGRRRSDPLVICGRRGAITLLTVQRITVDIAREWLSVSDICEYMGVSPFVVTKQLRSGSLPAVKFGREWRVARMDFEDWLNTQRTQPEGPQPD